MAASAKVLETYELLEDILLHLPLRQLLLVQRVSKTFRQLPQNSLKIQKALFLTPATNKTAEPDESERADFFGPAWASPEDGSGAIILLNPFIELLIPDRTLRPKQYISEEATKTTIRYSCGYNMFDTSPAGVAFPGRIKFDWDWDWAGVRWNSKLLREVPDKASISTMLMTDPPVTRVRVLNYALVREMETMRFDLALCRSSFLNVNRLRIADLQGLLSPFCHEEHAVRFLAHSYEWLPLPKGHNTTGWETLYLLATEGEQRKAVLREMYLAEHPTEIELISMTDPVSLEE